MGKEQVFKILLARSFDLRVQKPFNFLVKLGIGEVYLDWNGNKRFLASNHRACTNSDIVESILALK